MDLPLIILASSSIGRKQLLERLRIPFTVIPSTVDEDAITHDDPMETIRLRARAKIQDIITHNPQLTTHNLIIAADSMAVYKGKLYGKPKDNEDARRMLGILMGQTFQFFTHTVMILGKKQWEQTVETAVTFRKMSNSEVDLYLKTYDVTKFAGAFATELAPWDLITKIDGSFTNVIGLPFEAILPVFINLGILR